MNTTTRMATNTPTRKVQAMGLSAAITTVLVWLLNTYAHADIPVEIAMSMQGIVAVLVGYIVPPARQDVVVEG